jgi:glutathione synthase/RimK-type ligase-like ATP-grasp enzyme
MLKDRILIVTQQKDIHADVVLQRLRSLGHSPVRLHVDDIPTEASFSIKSIGSSVGGKLVTRNTSVDIESIKAVWWRKPKSSRINEHLNPREKRFARDEVDHALNGLWNALDCYWMSHPARIKAASYKPEQLKRAAALGFEIPRTLTTTRPDEVRQFYKDCTGRMIYKTLSNPMVARADDLKDIKCVRTTLLSERMLEDNLSGVLHAPCQFQEYIEKKFEYRVTIIGERLFIAEIDSQAQETTKLDWRHIDVPMLARKGELPEEIIEKCFLLMRSYDLTFSAIDLILTPDGRYVFLENNPNGQWLFIEKVVPELKMVDAIAQRLSEGLKMGF